MFPHGEWAVRNDSKVFAWKPHDVVLLARSRFLDGERAVRIDSKVFAWKPHGVVL